MINSLIYAVATLLERGAVICASIFASLSLSAVDFSAYGRFQIAATMVAGYATLGMSTLVAKLAAEMGVAKSHKGAQIRILWAGSAVLALALACIYAGGQTWAVGMFDPVRSLLFVMCTVAIAGAAVGSSVFLGLEEYRKALLVAASLFVALAFGFAAARFQSGAMAYVAAYVFGTVIWGVLSATLAIPLLRKRAASHRAASGDVRGLFRDAAPLMLISAVSGSLMWIMSTLLMARSDPTEHAKFLIGTQWSALVTFLPSVVTRVVFPRMVKAASGAVPAGGSRLGWLFLSSALTSLFTVVAAGLLLIVARPVNSIYSGEYVDVAHVILIYVVCSIPASVANLFGNQLVAQGQIRGWLVCSLVGAAVLVGLMYLWAVNGALAPAIAMAGGYSVMVLAAVFYLRRPVGAEQS